MNQLKEKQTTYYEFLSELSKGLADKLGRDYETRAVTNIKNNGIQSNGILIRRQDAAVAPTIYLDEYFKDYCSGRELSDIIRQIVYTYQEGEKESRQFSFESIVLSADLVRENLTCRLVNYQKNAFALKEIPHIRFLNLAIYFQIVVYRQEGGIGTIRFTKEHYRDYGSSQRQDASFSSLKELYSLALNNTARLFPARLSTLENIMESLSIGKEPASLPFTAQQADPAAKTMYVLSNTAGINGAGCLLYPNLLSQLKNFFRSEFYILPSSIHEVILVPFNKSIQREGLNDMIREINLSQVPPDEVLSDRAYSQKELAESLQALPELI